MDDSDPSRGIFLPPSVPSLPFSSAGHLIAQSDCKGTEEQEIGRTVNQR